MLNRDTIVIFINRLIWVIAGSIYAWFICKGLTEGFPGKLGISLTVVLLLLYAAFAVRYLFKTIPTDSVGEAIDARTIIVFILRLIWLITGFILGWVIFSALASTAGSRLWLFICLIPLYLYTRFAIKYLFKPVEDGND